MYYPDNVVQRISTIQISQIVSREMTELYYSKLVCHA